MSAAAHTTHEPAKTTASDTKRSGRIVQIHPTLRCNLACAHCYSSSAPGGKDGLSTEDLKPFLAAAREQGYDVVSLSGGEPFLYRDLEKLVDFAKSLDFQVNTATNGMLFGSERAKRILEKLDVIAVSIDGQRDLHDLMRLSDGAFDKMLEGIDVLQKMQKQFGLIHCVTPKSWEQLFWLGEFAHEKGAGLLQLHPLEMSGRATETLADWKTDQMLLHRAWIMGKFLAEKYQDSLFVQLDWFHKLQIEQDPNGVWAYPNGALPTDFSEWLPIISVRETGAVLPLCYGFSDHFSFGNVRNVATNPHFFDNFRAKKEPELAALFEKTWLNIVQNDDNDLIPWSELIEHESHRWIGQHAYA